MKFRDETHEQEFEALMKRMGADSRDVYRLALAYLITADEVCSKNIDNIYDFSEHCIKPDCLADEWQTGTSLKTCRLAFNLFNGGIGIGVGVLIFLGASKVFEFYTDDYADTLSLAVFLISLAVSVYFAEPIRAAIPINLLLLLILVHIVYVLIRWYVKGCKRSRGYY